MEVSPADPSGWVWSPLYSQMPRHVTSNLQRVHEEMDINRGRQPSQSTWEEPCDPRPTDSLPWTIATPSYSPGSRDVCQLQGHWARACCWAELLAGCPRCRGTAGSERPQLRLPPPACLRHSLLTPLLQPQCVHMGGKKEGGGGARSRQRKQGGQGRFKEHLLHAQLSTGHRQTSLPLFLMWEKRHNLLDKHVHP